MESFMGKISIIVRRMKLNAEHGMEEQELGFPEQMVLMVLSAGEPQNQDAIARILGVDKGSIARTIAKLEAKGLVSRRQNPSNRRENIVEITEPCKGIINEMHVSLDECDKLAFSGFTEEERELFMGYLDRIADNLSK